MINPNTGDIEIGEPKVKLNPKLKKGEFLSSSYGKIARLVVQNQEWCSFSVAVKEQGQDFTVLLVFNEDDLFETHLTKSDPNASWGQWSEQKENEKKIEYDRRLALDLGKPPYNFLWGKVESVLDLKSGASSIVIHYKIK